MVPVTDRSACLAGDAGACGRAVSRLEPEVTFVHAMKRTLPAVHAARMDCLVSFTTRGCELGSAWACASLAGALASLGRRAASRSASLEACRLGSADACGTASELGGNRGPQPPLSDERRLLAERACYLGSYHTCFALAARTLYGRGDVQDVVTGLNLARGRDPHEVARGLDYFEAGCLRARPDAAGLCRDLRQMLSIPAMPRRGPDDWLPYFAGGGGSSGTSRPAEGICAIDPNACPRPATVPSAPAPPPSERARILSAHRTACSAGDGRECLRLVELELLRFDHSVLADLQNQADPPAFDLASATHALCARGIAGACITLTYASYRAWTRDQTGGLRELFRACDLGAPLGCALAGQALPARDARTRGQREGLFARACSGGLAWACPGVVP
jgi:hypothetical protein